MEHVTHLKGEEMCPFNEVQSPYYRGVSDERFYCISLYSLHIRCLFLLRVYWCVLDGADCNRLFIKMHFHNKDPVDSKFVATVKHLHWRSNDIYHGPKGKVKIYSVTWDIDYIIMAELRYI